MERGFRWIRGGEGAAPNVQYNIHKETHTRETLAWCTTAPQHHSPMCVQIYSQTDETGHEGIGSDSLLLGRAEDSRDLVYEAPVTSHRFRTEFP